MNGGNGSYRMSGNERFRNQFSRYKRAARDETDTLALCRVKEDRIEPIPPPAMNNGRCLSKFLKHTTARSLVTLLGHIIFARKLRYRFIFSTRGHWPLSFSKDF